MDLAVTIALDERLIESQTWVVASSARVVVVASALTVPTAPATLYSTYVGNDNADGETAITHLLVGLGHTGDAPAQLRCPSAELPINDDRWLLLHDHLGYLQQALIDAGHQVGIEVADDALVALARDD